MIKISRVSSVKTMCRSDDQYGSVEIVSTTNGGDYAGFQYLNISAQHGGGSIRGPELEKHWWCVQPFPYSI